jgi:hypothetical protein
MGSWPEVFASQQKGKWRPDFALHARNEGGILLSYGGMA